MTGVQMMAALKLYRQNKKAQEAEPLSVDPGPKQPKRENRKATKLNVKFPGASGLIIDDKIAPK